MRVSALGLDHAGTEDSESLASLLTAISFLPFSAFARDTDPGDEPRRGPVDAGLRAREMAKRLALPHAESAALDALMSHALNTGPDPAGGGHRRRATDLGRAVSDPWEAGDTYAMAAWLSYDLGDYTSPGIAPDKGFARTVDDAPGVALHTLSWAASPKCSSGRGTRSRRRSRPLTDSSTPTDRVGLRSTPHRSTRRPPWSPSTGASPPTPIASCASSPRPGRTRT